MALVVFYVSSIFNTYISSIIIRLGLSIIIGAVIYIILAILTKSEEFKLILEKINIIKKKVNRGR